MAITVAILLAVACFVLSRMYLQARTKLQSITFNWGHFGDLVAIVEVVTGSHTVLYLHNNFDMVAVGVDDDDDEEEDDIFDEEDYTDCVDFIFQTLIENGHEADYHRIRLENHP